VYERIISAVKWAEFASDTMYIVLRGHWCDITVLNLHATTEDKIDDVKENFYKEFECVFDTFAKYHMKTLLGDSNAKMGREDIIKLTIRNDSLHKISNDNGVEVNFATSKNLSQK
jgi:hypothetical protein